MSEAITGVVPTKKKQQTTAPLNSLFNLDQKTRFALPWRLPISSHPWFRFSLLKLLPHNSATIRKACVPSCHTARRAANYLQEYIYFLLTIYN